MEELAASFVKERVTLVGEAGALKTDESNHGAFSLWKKTYNALLATLPEELA